METSAKTAMNVNDIFLAIGETKLPVHKEHLSHWQKLCSKW